MKNYNSSGDVVKTLATVDVASGAFVKIGDVYGFAADNATAGGDLVIKTQGVFVHAVADAAGFGDPVYFSGTALSLAGTADQKVGVCVGSGLVKLT